MVMDNSLLVDTLICSCPAADQISMSYLLIKLNFSLFSWVSDWGGCAAEVEWGVRGLSDCVPEHGESVTVWGSDHAGLAIE